MESFNVEVELRKQLKLMLYLLAKEQEQPGQVLQRVIQELIDELYQDVARAGAKRQSLSLIVSH